MLETNHKCQHRDGFSIQIRTLLSAAILCIAVATPTLGQTAGFSSVYSDTWIDGVAGAEYDELQATDPVFVAYSVGLMDPAAYDQSISIKTSIVSETAKLLRSTALAPRV